MEFFILASVIAAAANPVGAALMAGVGIFVLVYYITRAQERLLRIQNPLIIVLRQRGAK